VFPIFLLMDSEPVWYAGNASKAFGSFGSGDRALYYPPIFNNTI